MIRAVYFLPAVLLLCACQPEAASKSNSKNDVDESTLHAAGHVQRMFLSVPGVLIDQSTKLIKPLNLNDPEMVAHALGVTLTGDRKQVLYVIEMTAPTEHGMARREIPIRVDNIKDGAKMIREWQSPSL